MKHTEQLTGVIERENNNNKSLLVRATGKFYTPLFMTKNLIGEVLNHVDVSLFESRETLYVLDPFCGDGRLLVEFLRRINELGLANQVCWHIAFWDYDKQAVKKAQQNIASIVEEIGITAELAPLVHDSLLESGSYYGKFDFVITNPPWETIKPDRRELANMTPDQKMKYSLSLRKYDIKLTNALPHAQPTRKFAGWGTNLSRCGTQLSLMLTKNDGVCAIITPLSLLTDQTSSTLRQWIFSQANLLAVSYYPAEVKLFDNVDQESIAFVLKKEKASKFSTLVTKFGRNKAIRSRETLGFSLNDISLLGYSIPVVFGETLLRVLKKWQSKSTLEDLEHKGPRGLWMGRELDETRHSEFLSESGNHLFLKGRMVDRYVLCEAPTFYIREDMREIPKSAAHYRIVWRDVSRPSQARRVKATIIPPGVVTGNSLHVAHFQETDLNRLKALLVIMNSLPFEFQVRARLGTGHISLGVVRKIYIPSIDDDGLIEKLTAKLNELDHGKQEAEIDLEVLVALAYGLELTDYKNILSHFTNLPKDFTTKLVTHQAWADEKAIAA